MRPKGEERWADGCELSRSAEHFEVNWPRLLRRFVVLEELLGKAEGWCITCVVCFKSLE